MKNGEIWLEFDPPIYLRDFAHVSLLDARQKSHIDIYSLDQNLIPQSQYVAVSLIFNFRTLLLVMISF